MFKSLQLKSRRLLLPLFISVFVLSACSAPKMDCHTIDGKAAILDAVQKALTLQDCATAVDLIEPVYQDESCTNDEVRKARAASYACAANINFFELLGNLATSNILGNALWPAMTQLFPSVTGDERVTAGQLSLDALFAIKKSGAIASAAEQMNAGTANVGYLVASQREINSNVFSIFISMSLIGSLQNRYGDPDLSTFAKQRNMGAATSAAADRGWGDVMQVTPDACTYAASILTLVDSIDQVSQEISGSLGTKLAQVSSGLNGVLDAACDAGCKGLPVFGSFVTGCTIAAGCAKCPTQLRNRLACATPAVTDPVSCAAAGIVNFINQSALGWN